MRLALIFLLAAGIAGAQEPMGPCKPGTEARSVIATKYPHLKNPVKDSGNLYFCKGGLWKIVGGWSNGFSSAEDSFGNSIPLEYSDPQECEDGYRQTVKTYDYRHIGGIVFSSYSCVPEK